MSSEGKKALTSGFMTVATGAPVIAASAVHREDCPPDARRTVQFCVPAITNSGIQYDRSPGGNGREKPVLADVLMWLYVFPV